MKEAEIKKSWEKALDYLKKSPSMTKLSFETWIEPLSPASVNEEAFLIYINAPSEQIIKMIKSSHYVLIEEALEAGFGASYTPIFKVKEKKTEEKKLKKSVETSIRDTGLENEFYLNPKYSFDNFIVGENNRYAHAAAVAVAENPSKQYNPFFLYGGSGLGKTHLMHAIGHYVLDNHTDKKVLYVSSEMFTNELISCLNEKNMHKKEMFQNKYRNVDLLLIDDIQFLKGKESTQIEFFNTFEALSAANKQMVITADCRPSDLTFLDERIRSRLQSNLVADIEPPDYETRVAILINNAKLEGIEVDEDIMKVISVIAENIKDNVRELEGAFSRVTSFSTMFNEKIDLKFAKNILNDIFASIEKKITPEKIKREVCDFFEIKLEDMNSKKRSQNIAYPRHIAMYLCREITDMSFPKIGEAFGGKDHSTIHHAYEKICKEIEEDEKTAEMIEELKSYIM